MDGKFYTSKGRGKLRRISKLFFLAVSLCVLLISSNVFASSVHKVKYGQTFMHILADSFEPQTIISMYKEIKKKYPDFVLKAGAEYHRSEDNYVFKFSSLSELRISKVGEGDYHVEMKRFPVTTVRTTITGEVESSLIGAAIDAGESEILAYKIASILEWEVDFFKDLRKGDKFSILIDKKFVNGKFYGYGRILALDFINQGRIIRALYYENGKTQGYFTPDGKSMKKGFLKAPLKFSRISSGYTSRRLHPVHKVYRPHYGIDYAAPRGTPVRATADGRITMRRRKGGNGNIIKLRHANGYETFYIHLCCFKKGYRVGSWVRQGDIIAYVGSTGYSTGPHLDYRIKKHGRYLNPLRFKAPTKKLDKKYISDFQEKTEIANTWLDRTYIKMTGKTKMLM